MTLTINAPSNTGDLSPFLLQPAARHRVAEVLFQPGTTTLVLPAVAPPAPQMTVTRVYNPVSTTVERPLFGHGGEHRQHAPTWALLALGAGLGLLGLAVVAGLAVLAVVA